MAEDERRPGLLAKGFIKAARLYQLTLSPYLGRNCRFSPTCSAYAIDALHKHPLPKAMLLTIWRILRCNPFCRGGYDPVPPAHKDEK